MEYTEEDLKKIEDSLIKQIDDEETFLQEIENLAKSIAERLEKQNHIREEFLDTEYIFSIGCNKETKIMTLFRTNPVKMVIAPDKYRPASFQCEFDLKFTYFENVYMLVKAALCSAAGIINVE